MGRLTAVLTPLTGGVSAALIEPPRLGRTLTKRAPEVLASFARPDTSNGPAEAIKAVWSTSAARPRLRNLTHYIAGLLLATGGLRRRVHPRS